MNRSVRDTGGGILAVVAIHAYASTKKGHPAVLVGGRGGPKSPKPFDALVAALAAELGKQRCRRASSVRTMRIALVNGRPGDDLAGFANAAK